MVTSKLPIIITKIQELILMQNRWSAILNVMLGNPSLQCSILNNVALVDGTTVVNHLLGRNLQGWRIIGNNAGAVIYDKQASNQTPQLTLVLVSSAACTVQLEVF